MILYTYFVSFIWQDKHGHQGFRDCAAKGKAPLANYDEIQKMRDAIREENNYESVTILNFLLLKVEG